MFLSSVTAVECSRIYDLVLAKGVLPGKLENDLAYASNLSSCDLLSIYMCARSIKGDDEKEDDEKETKGKRQFETTQGATRVKVI